MRRTVLAAIGGSIVGALITGGTVAIATPNDPCAAAGTDRAYMDCRFDRIDKALGVQPSAAPSPAPSATAPPSASATPTPEVSPTTSPSATQGATPNGPTGAWSLKFADEFNGTTVDWSKWADTSSAEADQGRGNKGNKQLEWNRAANCTVADGILTQTAKPAVRTGTNPPPSTYAWESCLISSAPSYAFRYGYIEIRAKLPDIKGFWPAFWTWQASGNNTWTETDVYEFYSDNPNRLYLTQHSSPSGGCTLVKGTSAGFNFNPGTGFHTYGADIKASGGTDFYIDGVKVCTAAGTSTGNTNLIVDTFVFADIPPAAGTVGRHQIDYVRAWQR